MYEPRVHAGDADDAPVSPADDHVVPTEKEEDEEVDDDDDDDDGGDDDDDDDDERADAGERRYVK